MFLFAPFIKIYAYAPTEMGPGKVGDVVTPPGPWTTFGWLHRGNNQQDVPRQSFLGHSGHMAEPT